MQKYKRYIKLAFVIIIKNPAGFLKASHMEKIKNYLRESLQELSRVTWPTKNQAVNLTLIVLGFMLVSAALFGFADFAFNSGYQFLLKLSI